jgi:threonine/homoserine/homoserine lactone efflux protein
MTALGNVSATLIQALVSVVGLSIILIKIGFLFNIIKYAGAAYIIYIGFKIINGSDNAFEMPDNKSVRKVKSSGLFNEAFLVTMGNPKAIVFFTALFPQFIDREKETVFTLFVLITLLLIIAFSCMMIYIVFGQNIHKVLINKKRKVFFNRVTGFSFIGLGIGLVFSKAEK